jgi:DNA-binding MarR family transcriptional regulator
LLVLGWLYEGEHLQGELILSSPSRTKLKAWRLFFESAWALLDVLDRELQEGAGIPLRWYDVLVHLEEAPDERLRMGDLADAILSSKSGLTRVVDKMEEAGLVCRERPDGDRRVIEVALTAGGREALAAARPIHRDGIRRHFASHLDAEDVRALTRGLRKVRDAVRPAR